MNFTTGKTYRFRGNDKMDHYGASRLKNFKLVYLRHVGKVDLFQHPTAGWLESFTLWQTKSYEIEEVRT